jgi:acetate kinase
MEAAPARALGYPKAEAPGRQLCAVKHWQPPGLDAFVFTAGIGENSDVIRARIVEKLVWFGVSIDPAANAAHALRISRPDGRVAVLVVPIDEELMIARHTVTLLGGPRQRGCQSRRKA